MNDITSTPMTIYVASPTPLVNFIHHGCFVLFALNTLTSAHCLLALENKYKLVFCACRLTATQMGWWISLSLLQLHYMCINWRSMTLISGSYGHKLLLRNLTWIKMAILLQKNFEWLVSCLFPPKHFSCKMCTLNKTIQF